MFLGIDIGNTTTTFAILKDKTCLKQFTFETNLSKRMMALKLAVILRKITRSYPKIDRVLICSVVPKTLRFIKPIIQEKLKVKLFIIGKDIKVPIKNCYRNPHQVGQDRLVCAYAAKRLYRSPAIVVDLGTAITFDVVSKNGDYVGGIIVPGIRLSLESLFKKTALLPLANVQRPKSLIGKDTKTSMLSGVLYGYATLLDGLIRMIQKQIKGRPVVIMTGGHTRLMAKFLNRKIIIEPDLIFKGLSLIALHQR